MSELSPAARAVFESFNSKFDWVEDGVPGPQFSAIAAALRAAADQLGDEMIVVGEGFKSLTRDDWRIVHVEDLLAIADELEAQ